MKLSRKLFVHAMVLSAVDTIRQETLFDPTPERVYQLLQLKNIPISFQEVEKEMSHFDREVR
jgi:hypothetical protein